MLAADAGWWLRGTFSSPIIFPDANWETCSKIKDIQALTAKWAMLSAMIVMIPSLFTMPFFTSLSDVFGRRPFFIIGCTVICSSFITIVCISAFNLGLWPLLLARLANGIFAGGGILVSNMATVFITETSSILERSTVLVRLQACITVVMAVGPFIGGVLAKKIANSDHIFLISIGLFALSFIFSVLFLPESNAAVRKAQRRRARIAAAARCLDGNEAQPLISDDDALTPEEQPKVVTVASVFSQLIDNLRVVFRLSGTRSFLLLVIAQQLLGFGESGRGVFFYYCSYLFGWDSLIEGEYKLIDSTSNLVYMLALFPALQQLYASMQKDPRRKLVFDLSVVKVTFVCAAVIFALLAVANSTAFIFVLRAIEGFGPVTGIVAFSIMTNTMSPEHHGALLSGVTLLSTIAMIFSSLVYPYVWSRTVGTSVPNAFLIIGAIIVALSAVLVQFVRADDLPLDPSALEAVADDDSLASTPTAGAESAA
nr:hypothetical protein HK105_002566 [Polyrhizophydium stewartii]